MSSAESPITAWDPTPILDERLLRGKPYRFSLVILNQPIHNIPLFLDLWRRATVRIAADGGANRVYAIRDHLSPAAAAAAAAQSFPKLDFIVGDLDSLQDETKAWFLSQWADPSIATGPDADVDADANARPGQIIRIDDQDSADFAKAVKHARELARRRRRSRCVRRRERPLGAGEKGEEEEDNGDDILCYSGLGGRVDQAMSQLHHLYLFQQRRQRRSSASAEGEGEGESGGGGGDENRYGGDDVEDEGEEDNNKNNNGYANGRMYLTNGESLTFVLLAGQHHIRIRSRQHSHDQSHNYHHDHSNSNSNSKPLAFGKHVGIIPLAGPSELTTRGLQWDVSRWRTAFGERLSTSNHTTAGADVVEVETSRDVLFTIDVPVSG